jgi:hypothetical protein
MTNLRQRFRKLEKQIATKALSNGSEDSWVTTPTSGFVGKVTTSTASG